MCGITGIYNPHISPDLSVVDKMAAVIRHRGPDYTSRFTSKHLSLVYHRLAILDTSTAGNQVFSRGPWTVWLNGCIYNYKELRKQVEAVATVHFYSETDTEVLAAAFHYLGLDAVKQFNGMFAIVAYNSATGQCYLIRDRYGIKPMYYWQNGQQTVFASECKAILKHPKYTPGVNRHAVHQWFTYQNYFDDSTLFQDIKLLPPGTIYNVTNSESIPFWEWQFDSTCVDDYDTATHTVAHLFKKAVARQTVSDRPIGAWLSGGVDSTAIVCNSPVKLETFTCRMSNYQFDESWKVNGVSAHTSHPNHQYCVRPQSIRDHLAKTIYHLEDLRVGPSYSNYALADLTAKHVTVNLQGTGGDELFASYPWRYEKGYNDNRTGLDPSRIYKNPYSPTNPAFKEYQQIHDARHFLHGVLLVGDKLSMAHGIEDRVPFLDNDLVDYVTTLPFEWRLNKKILKDALYLIAGYERSALYNKLFPLPKQGFTNPDSWWFPSHNKEFIYNHLKKKQYRDFIDVDIDVKNTPLTWCMIAFEEWINQFMRGELTDCIRLSDSDP